MSDGRRILRAAGIALLLLGSASLGRADRQAESRSSGRRVLPPALSKFIANRFPDLRLPGRSDMTGGWARYSKGGSAPYACWGDFNGDGRRDVALILLGREAWELLAFHARDDGGYDVLEPHGFPGAPGSFERAIPAQKLRLFTIKKGARLKVGLEAQPPYEYDSFAAALIADTSSVVHFEWVALSDSKREEDRRLGTYTASRFNDLTD